MVLDPIFFKTPPGFDDISEDSGLYFRILGYSQAANYTLVTWGYGDREEMATGQNLYRDRELVAHSGGALFDLEELSFKGKASEPDYQQLMQQSVRSDNYGVPQHVVDRLLDPANYHNFVGGSA